MVQITRYEGNPILLPNKENKWEASGTFNPSVILNNGIYHLFYRAMSSPFSYNDRDLSLSTIGHAQSRDGVSFNSREQLIFPKYDWERFGCEDPRVSKIGDKYYIFYTALSDYPPSPDGIKVGVAVTKDFQKLEKHQVTFFNSKAMALFPEKIGGKIAAVLTVNTDRPPSSIALAFFDDESQIWSKEYWDKWLPDMEKYSLPLQRLSSDQVEIGAAPVKTEKGWLLVYCYIQNYLGGPDRVFRMEAVLLDLENPLKIVGRTDGPILVPEKDYELYGNVPDVIFPEGALIEGKELLIYYGAADTMCCLARLNLNSLLEEMQIEEREVFLIDNQKAFKLIRYEGNPLLHPIPNHDWEAQSVFNAGAIYENEKVHLLYRALGKNNVSTLGYAAYKDGLQLEERFDNPVYVPRETFEKKVGDNPAGCEDPRLTRIEDTIYMCYTAFNGQDPWRVALTTINVNDFINHNWNWTLPTLITPPGSQDKNAGVIPDKIGNQFAFFHRIEPCIWIDYVDDLNFRENRWLEGKILMQPRTGEWDSKKIGIGPAPIKTDDGWLLIYHGVSQKDEKYRLGMSLLDLNKPDRVISRLSYPILEPETEYEHSGIRPGTVFSCGAVVLNGNLMVYYGASDKVLAVASGDIKEAVEVLKANTGK